jgi:hypothetical protein
MKWALYVGYMGGMGNSTDVSVGKQDWKTGIENTTLKWILRLKCVGCTIGFSEGRIVNRLMNFEIPRT